MRGQFEGQLMSVRPNGEYVNADIYQDGETVRAYSKGSYDAGKQLLALQSDVGDGPVPIRFEATVFVSTRGNGGPRLAVSLRNVEVVERVDA